MLVHVTRYTAVQRQVRAEVEAEVKNIRNRMRVGGGRGILDDLKALWESDYVPTIAKVRSILPERLLKPVSWPDVEPHLLDVVESIRVSTINGTAGDVLDYETHRETGLTVIAIGGDKLARGLTLEGLSVSYFLRASKMYDTLMQMGRWFGFRPGYLDLCRLYTTAELNEWFAHLTQANEELRREFDLMYAIKGTPKDYGLRVRSHPTMMVTSKVKMRNATEILIDFAGAIQETVTFGRQQNIIHENLVRTERFLEDLGAPTETGPERPRSGGRVHKWAGARLWSGVPASKIISFMKDYETHEAAVSVESKTIAKFIQAQMDRSELTTWTAAVFAGDGPAATLAGFETRLVRRSANTRAKDLAQQQRDGVALIRRLLAPRDEAIDFDADEYDEALKFTRDEWVRDPARSNGKEPPDTPSGPAIRTVRGRRPQNGILLLYPLDPEPLALQTGDPLVGFGVSFPRSKHSKAVPYMVNNIYYDQEYRAEE